MNLKQLFTEDRAVSPVIGVILMVAITVILAAVIGTFVLGLGDQVNNNAPQASFEYDFASDTKVTITHTGGDTLDDSTLSITVAGTEAYDGSGSGIAGDFNGTDADDGWDSDITAGDSLVMNADGGASSQSDSEVRIIWTNPSGGSTNTISTATWP